MSFGNRRRAPRPGGVGEYFMPHGEVVTIETATCRHCQAIIDVTPRAKGMLPTCDRCHSIVCPLCKASGECLPFEKLCEIEERADVGNAVRDDERHLRFLIEREKGRTQFFLDYSKATA